MPGADAPDLLFGPGSGRFEQSRESERGTEDRLQDMEPLGPPRLPAIEPAGDLRTLVAIDRDQRIALGHRLFLDVEQRLAVDHGKKDGDRPRFARSRLDLPGTGKLRLGGGQRVVLLA